MKPLPRIFDSPALIFLIATTTIFVSELIVMLILSILPPVTVFREALLDSLLLTLMLLPPLFLLIYKPFQIYIAELKKANDAIQASEKRFRDISDNALEWIWEVDSDGKYTYASPAVEKILGYKPEEILNKRHFSDFFHPQSKERTNATARETFKKKQSFREFVNLNVHKEGNEVWLSTSGIPILSEEGQLLGYRGAGTDITEQKKMELELKEVAITDELTGILNRRGFHTLADQQCKISNRSKSSIALMYVDLDNFKTINDELGHKEGDQALVDTARILVNTFRKADIVGRVGGDEFAVLLIGPLKPNIAELSMKSLQDSLRIHNEGSNRGFELSASMGVACWDPEASCTLEELLTQADKLMYENKILKRNARKVSSVKSIV